MRINKTVMKMSRILSPLLITMLLLVLTEWWVASLVPGLEMQLEDDYLLPKKHTLHSLDIFIKHMKQPPESNRLKMIAIGDSTFRTGDGSLGFMLRNELRKVADKPIQFFNLTKGGLSIAEKYLLAEQLAPYANLIYLNILYSPEQLGLKPVVNTHDDLPRLVGRAWNAEERHQLNQKEERPFFQPNVLVDNTIDNFLKNHWLLYRYNSLLAINVFGNAPREWIKSLITKENGVGSTLHQSWQHFSKMISDRQLPKLRFDTDHAPFLSSYRDVDALPKAKKDAMLWHGNLQRLQPLRPTNTSSDLWWIKRLSEVAHRNPKTLFVIFISRFNTDLVRHYRLIDQQRYQDNIAVIGTVLAGKNVLFLDYNNPRYHWPIGHFTDLVHTPGQGAADLAAHLAADSKSFVIEASHDL